MTTNFSKRYAGDGKDEFTKNNNEWLLKNRDGKKTH